MMATAQTSPECLPSVLSSLSARSTRRHRSEAPVTALLHRLGGFLNVAARGVKGNKGHRRFGEWQSLSGILKINDVGKFIGKQRSDDYLR